MLVENKIVREEVLEFANDVSSLLRKNEELDSSLACLMNENDLLKCNASIPCNSCVTLNDNLDKARNEIALLKSSAFLPCVF